MFFLEKLQEKRIQKKTDAFKKSGCMRYFHYDFGNMSEGMVSYTLTEEAGEIKMVYQKKSMKDGAEVLSEMLLPLTVFNELKSMFMDERLFLWNGFNKSNSVIATGASFNLHADFDYYRFRCQGMSMQPPAYEEKHELLSEYLKTLLLKHYSSIEQV